MPGMGTAIFKLTIEDAGNGNFDVHADDAKDQAMRITLAVSPSITELITRLHDRGALGFLSFLAQEQACTTIGEFLFKNFFVGPVLQGYRDYRLRNHTEPRIALQLPPSLYYLPWEVLRDPQENYGQFLSVQGSVIRYDVQSRPESTLYADEQQSANYLFLVASTEERPIGPYEPEGHGFINFLQVAPATYRNFGTRLTRSQPFALVFFGHGNLKQDQGYLIFSMEQWRRFRKIYVADPKAGYAVGNDLGAIKNLRIAYIFACESAWATQVTSFDNSITGAILQRSGLAYVVGAQTPIDFFAAQEFFESTLGALEDGFPLDLALSQGRRDVRSMDPNDAIRSVSYRDWWVPVLYARTTNFDVFPKKESIPVQRERPAESSGESVGYFSALKNSAERLFHSDNESSKDIFKPRS